MIKELSMFVRRKFFLLSGFSECESLPLDNDNNVIGKWEIVNTITNDIAQADAIRTPYTDGVEMIYVFGYWDNGSCFADYWNPRDCVVRDVSECANIELLEVV